MTTGPSTARGCCSTRTLRRAARASAASTPTSASRSVGLGGGLELGKHRPEPTSPAHRLLADNYAALPRHEIAQGERAASSRSCCSRSTSRRSSPRLGGEQPVPDRARRAHRHARLQRVQPALQPQPGDSATGRAGMAAERRAHSRERGHRLGHLRQGSPSASATAATTPTAVRENNVAKTTRSLTAYRPVRAQSPKTSLQAEVPPPRPRDGETLGLHFYARRHSPQNSRTSTTRARDRVASGLRFRSSDRE